VNFGPKIFHSSFTIRILIFEFKQILKKANNFGYFKASWLTLLLKNRSLIVGLVEKSLFRECLKLTSKSIFSASKVDKKSILGAKKSIKVDKKGALVA